MPYNRHHNCLHKSLKESITSQKPGSLDFWQIANSVLNKGESAIPPLFTRPEVLSFTSELIWDCIFLQLPRSLKRSLWSLIYERHWSWLYSSGGSNELWVWTFIILAELFNMCLEESCFPDCWKVLSVTSVFKNVGLQLKTTTLLVFFLWLAFFLNL